MHNKLDALKQFTKLTAMKPENSHSGVTQSNVIVLTPPEPEADALKRTRIYDTDGSTAR